MLYVKDSTAVHLRLGRRHISLCRKTPGAEQFATRIHPKLDRLAEKEVERIAAVVSRENAYDDVVLSDTLLDNTVRTTYEQVVRYDRDRLTQYAATLFPDHGYSSIVQMSMSKEPQEVDRLTVKL